MASDLKTHVWCLIPANKKKKSAHNIIDERLQR